MGNSQRLKIAEWQVQKDDRSNSINDGAAYLSTIGSFNQPSTMHSPIPIPIPSQPPCEKYRKW